MRTELKSSHVRACEHEPSQDGMTLEFTDGKRYSYPDVPREIIDGLLQHASPGRYFRTNIRERFKGKKV